MTDTITKAYRVKLILSELISTVFIVALAPFSTWYYLTIVHQNPLDHYEALDCEVHGSTISVRGSPNEAVELAPPTTTTVHEEDCSTVRARVLLEGSHLIGCYRSEKTGKIFRNSLVGVQSVAILGILLTPVIAFFRMRVFAEQMRKVWNASSMEELRSKSAALQYALYAAISVFLILIVVIVGTHDFIQRSTKNWTSASCKVIDTCMEGKDSPQLVVMYEHSVQGVTYRSDSYDGLAASSAPFEEGVTKVPHAGETIPCFFNPDRPSQMMLHAFDPISWTYVAIFVGGAAAYAYLPSLIAALVALFPKKS